MLCALVPRFNNNDNIHQIENNLIDVEHSVLTSMEFTTARSARARSHSALPTSEIFKQMFEEENEQQLLKKNKIKK